MKIRYDARTLRINGIGKLPNMESDTENTIVEIPDSTSVPTDSLRNYAFGTVQSPFVLRSDWVQEEKDIKDVKKVKKQALLTKLNLTKEDFKLLLELIQDKNDD